jgi:hypothetical protein
MWGAIGLGTYMQDDTALWTMAIDMLDECVLEYVGSSPEWVVRYIVVLDETPCLIMQAFFLHWKISGQIWVKNELRAPLV